MPHAQSPLFILGIDPGLQKTGYGIIRSEGNSLSFVACGVLRTTTADELPVRLAALNMQLNEIIARYKPQQAAVEETFVNAGVQSALKLGQARGALLLTLSLAGLSIGEYAATQVKKSIVGAGRAEKEQVAHMVQLLLPGCGRHGLDAMDALAIAICHAHHLTSPQLAVGIRA